MYGLNQSTMQSHHNERYHIWRTSDTHGSRWKCSHARTGSQGIITEWCNHDQLTQDEGSPYGTGHLHTHSKSQRSGQQHTTRAGHRREEHSTRRIRHVRISARRASRASPPPVAFLSSVSYPCVEGRGQLEHKPRS